MPIIMQLDWDLSYLGNTGILAISLDNVNP